MTIEDLRAAVALAASDNTNSVGDYSFELQGTNVAITKGDQTVIYPQNLGVDEYEAFMLLLLDRINNSVF